MPSVGPFGIKENNYMRARFQNENIQIQSKYSRMLIDLLTVPILFPSCLQNMEIRSLQWSLSAVLSTFLFCSVYVAIQQQQRGLAEPISARASLLICLLEKRKGYISPKSPLSQTTSGVWLSLCSTLATVKESPHKQRSLQIQKINVCSTFSFRCVNRKHCLISTQQQKLASTRQQMGSQVESSQDDQNDEEKREKQNFGGAQKGKKKNCLCLQGEMKSTVLTDSSPQLLALATYFCPHPPP